MGRSTKDEKKREQERRIFEMFASHITLPAGEIVYDDRPDVLIDGPRKIGVEITDLYLADGDDPTSEQVQRRCREAVLERAQRLYLSTGGRPIEFHFAFAIERPIQSVEPLAVAIAQLASRLQHEHSGQIPDYLFDHIPELDWVYWNGKEYPDARWKITQSYSTPLLALPRVAKAIAEKTKSAAKYRPCDCYWLLIVVDFWNPAQDQDTSWPEGASVHSGAFERIWIYRTHWEPIQVPAYR
ncbi:hypothetical protein [Paraburkholderia bannensis]|uniref:hypothetical protein n=1 Tax=Paraburkholderia bannensis TaxID=765414 RepID=UPI0012ECAF8B|nr:hypothetical protein [Paraburkholderia bannensis]